MGGNAFTTGDDPLSTPRMPHGVYAAIKQRCHQALHNLYCHVGSPLDGPGKADHGDVDVLVATPNHPNLGPSEAWEAIRGVLAAERVVVNTGDGRDTAHFALLWPSNPDSETKDGNEDETSFTAPPIPSHKDRVKHFAQVDIRICSSPEKFHWMLFKHAHGDFVNIVGSIVRPFGLTIDDTSFWLRVPEIEKHHKSRSKIHLTSEPTAVLKFLGLAEDENWDRTFDNTDAMFYYIANCRFFRVYPADKTKDDVPCNSAAEESVILKSDRLKRKKRPVFDRWFTEFMPRCRETGQYAYGKKAWTRDEVKEEAFAVFNIKAEYDRRRHEFLLERQYFAVRTELIKSCVPTAEIGDSKAVLYQSCLIKALKKIILDGEKSYGVITSDDELKDDEGYFIESKVVDFIQRNQDVVGSAALKQHHERYAQHNFGRHED